METAIKTNDIDAIRKAEETARKMYERETVAGGGYTIAELRAGFDMVSDPENWKNPIDAFVRPEFFNLVRHAVMHFSGCDLTLGNLNSNGKIHIKAVGYYVAIGA